MISMPSAKKSVHHKRPSAAFRMLRWLALSMLSLHVASPAQAAPPAAVTPEQAYRLALEARTLRDYPAMLALLRQAGEGGSLTAQEMLGSVLLTGSALYGETVRANPCEAARWIRQAAARGSAVARHQRVVLNGLRDLPQGRKSCVAAND